MLYTFKAKKLSGEEINGEREAAQKRDLARALRQEGFTLIAASEKNDLGNTGGRLTMPAIPGLGRLFGRVSLQEKLMFARNLSVMIGAGLSLTRALDTLERQTRSAAFKSIINDISSRIRKGEAFTDSLAKHPNVFSTLFVAMVSAGEASGTLDSSLNLLAAQLKDDYELRRKVRGALIYPAVIFCVMILIGVLMLIYVVPTLTSTFAELKVELPMSTKAVIAISTFLTTHGIVSLVTAIVFIVGALFAMRTQTIKHILDRIIVHLPIIGKLSKQLNAARTCRTMSSLISSGVSILQTLTITHDVLQNHLFKNILDEARESIQKGETMTETFKKHDDLYPVLVSEMIAVGEETGKTAAMLERLAEFYEGEIAAATKDLSSIIEPFLMVIIGAVVGLFAVSMIQPLYTSIAVGF
ncbi:MAG: hypothetical protein G01um101429_541 [Parcubacteria group bacterium Gr01-1014_29]|nr:MAG: hypothetical protein G01um101429_541 [Parcubacteria group bacterium Gr01-1014_29]